MLKLFKPCRKLYPQFEMSFKKTKIKAGHWVGSESAASLCNFQNCIEEGLRLHFHIYIFVIFYFYRYISIFVFCHHRSKSCPLNVEALWHFGKASKYLFASEKRPVYDPLLLLIQAPAGMQNKTWSPCRAACAPDICSFHANKFLCAYLLQGQWQHFFFSVWLFGSCTQLQQADRGGQCKTVFNSLDSFPSRLLREEEGDGKWGNIKDWIRRTIFYLFFYFFK